MTQPNPDTEWRWERTPGGGYYSGPPLAHADHPITDPGDGRTECDVCGKWVFLVTHSCKGVPVTRAAWDRHQARVTANAVAEHARLAAQNDTEGS